MAQEGSPQGVVSLSSLQEALGKVGRGVIREQRARRGDPDLIVYLSILTSSETCSTSSPPKGGAQRGR